MERARPLVITIVGGLFVLVGCASLVAGVLRFTRDVQHPGGHHDLIDLGVVVATALMAGAGGAFLFRGDRWARWLLVAWMGAHVAISALHSPVELALHVVIFSVLTYLLFRPEASAYVRARGGNRL